MGRGCTAALLLAGWAPLGKAPDTAVRCLVAPMSCGTDSVHPICASGTGSGVCLHVAGWRPSGQYLLDASDLRSAGRSGDAVTGAGACPADTVPSDCVCPQSRAALSARDEASDPPTDLTVEVESAVGFTAAANDNLIWHPQTAILAYTSGSLLVLEDLSTKNQTVLQGHEGRPTPEGNILLTGYVTHPLQFLNKQALI